MELLRKSRSKPTIILVVSEVTTLAARIETLSRKTDGLSLPKPAAVMECDTCGGGHTSTDCMIVGVSHGPIEQVNFIDSALRL